MLEINNSYSVRTGPRVNTYQTTVKASLQPAKISSLLYNVFTVGLSATAHVASSKIAWLSRNITGSPSLQLKFFP